LKETRPLWPPQRGVGLQEPNLGKTNLRVSLPYSLGICFCALSRRLVSLLLTLTRLVVVFIFVNFSFTLFTPPLGDFHYACSSRTTWNRCSTAGTTGTVEVERAPSSSGITNRDSQPTVAPPTSPIATPFSPTSLRSPQGSSSTYHPPSPSLTTPLFLEF
jgi:hypothetical protein